MTDSTKYFKQALDKTLTYEGGWSDNPKDPGGATMHGITLATYRLFKPNATKHDLLIIPPAMVEHIYRTNYWDNVSGDKLPPGISAVVFDYAVNSGVGRALRALKAAQEAYPTEPARMVAHICDSRQAFLETLRTFPAFGKGWTRRVADLKAFGISAASSAPPVTQVTASPRKTAQAASGTAIALTPVLAHQAGLPLWAVGLLALTAIGVILTYFCLRKTTQ